MPVSPRVRRVFHRVMDGKEEVKPAMIAEGYSLTTAGNPYLVTRTKSWKELLDEYLPQEKLARKHDQLLNSEKDETAIKALDLAYKVRGDYAPVQSMSVHVTVKPSEHKVIADEYEAKLLEQLNKSE